MLAQSRTRPLWTLTAPLKIIIDVRTSIVKANGHPHMRSMVWFASLSPKISFSFQDRKKTTKWSQNFDVGTSKSKSKAEIPKPSQKWRQERMKLSSQNANQKGGNSDVESKPPRYGIDTTCSTSVTFGQLRWHCGHHWSAGQPQRLRPWDVQS